MQKVSPGSHPPQRSLRGGRADAEIMFIGEGPGKQEDLTGRPFVGRAGELLTRIIENGMGIPRSEVYIANIVKVPPHN